MEDGFSMSIISALFCFNISLLLAEAFFADGVEGESRSEKQDIRREFALRIVVETPEALLPALRSCNG
jgi:hypothetical protein